MATFQKGDRVRVNGHSPGFDGQVGTITGCGLSPVYQISLDNGADVNLYAYKLDLIRDLKITVTRKRS